MCEWSLESTNSKLIIASVPVELLLYLTAKDNHLHEVALGIPPRTGLTEADVDEVQWLVNSRIRH